MSTDARKKLIAVVHNQVRDYTRRKGWSLESAEKWLQPNLTYASQVQVF